MADFQDLKNNFKNMAAGICAGADLSLSSLKAPATVAAGVAALAPNIEAATLAIDYLPSPTSATSPSSNTYQTSPSSSTDPTAPLSNDGGLVGIGTGTLPAAASSYQISHFAGVFFFPHVSAAADPTVGISQSYFDHMKWQFTAFDANITSISESQTALNNNVYYLNGNVDVTATPTGHTISKAGIAYHAFLVTVDTPALLGSYTPGQQYSFTLAQDGNFSGGPPIPPGIVPRIGTVPGTSIAGANFAVGYHWNGSSYDITGFTNMDSANIRPAYELQMDSIPEAGTSAFLAAAAALLAVRRKRNS